MTEGMDKPGCWNAEAGSEILIDFQVGGHDDRMLDTTLDGNRQA
jgi:hypothetical protein